MDQDLVVECDVALFDAAVHRDEQSKLERARRGWARSASCSNQGVPSSAPIHTEAAASPVRASERTVCRVSATGVRLAT
ncbi:MAG: hypothetical protein WKF83_04430 [Nocardioidaceae bacterium]